MITCPNCGQENPQGFKFCGNCAVPLVAAPAAREQRKVVTILFCDITGSTSLGESADPETLRALLARYFERMKGIVEAHGGTVEKFIGDAVMAAFGVPQVHEDDALRAVRAAIEMRDALPELGVQARIGVNTGEVVTGTAERLATGDAVNVAARLEQAAQPGEIIIGAETYDLVSAVVDATAIEPLALRGKAQSVPAYLLAGLAGTPTRRNEAPMVGRATELRRLHDAYAQATRDRSCQLFTVLGNAGVGKSRLVHEFLDALDATVVQGTCLAYGDGITYWPVAEVIRQLQQARPDIHLDGELAGLLGQESFTVPSDQIAWSFRKLLEEAATERPLVVVFDDIQWAEPTFLDLIEHVADLSRDAPILLLCMARPDLLDRRPTWAGGKLNATNLLLEPLSGDESAQMVESMVGGLSDRARERVIQAAEGNPLFVEEMVAFVRESGDENVRVPPTIHALLAARLDQLDESERQVLERGSIEGRLFHRGAVEALSSDGGHVATRLTSLVRKDLVRPDKPEVVGEDAFRFRHLLIRDAAYDALPKSTRADLHERFARWLEEFGADLPELDEILGYHLEQAISYRLELGQSADESLVERARQRLTVAGRRAFNRGDLNAAANLLGRADELPGPVDVTVQSDLIMACLWDSQPDRAAQLAERHLARAVAAGNDAAALCSRMEIERLRMFSDPRGVVQRLTSLTQQATTLFGATGDSRGMYVTYAALAMIANMHCDVAAVVEVINAAARLDEELSIGNPSTSGLANWRILSAEPNGETLTWFANTPTQYQVGIDEHHAEALALAGRFEEARVMVQRELRVAEALGATNGKGDILGFAGSRVEFQAGDFVNAASLAERGTEILVEARNPSVASTAAGHAARAHLYAGNIDAAAHWAERANELSDPDDVMTQLFVSQVRGVVAAHRGEAASAESQVEAAVERAKPTHSPLLIGDAYFDAGTAYALLGNNEAAVAAYRSALAQYEAKEAIVLAERARQKLAELDA